MFKDSLRLHALDKITTNIQSDFIFFMKIGFAANCKNRGKKNIVNNAKQTDWCELMLIFNHLIHVMANLSIRIKLNFIKNSLN